MATNKNILAIVVITALFAMPSFSATAETPLHSARSLDVGGALPWDNKRNRTNVAKLEKACKARVGAACLALGTVMLKQKHAIEARMFSCYKAACDADNADGCAEQGRMVMNSEGGPNADEAVQIFSKGCDGGSAFACYYKADLLEDGELLPRDFEAARAAEARGAELLRQQGVEFATPSRTCCTAQPN